MRRLNPYASEQPLAFEPDAETCATVQAFTEDAYDTMSWHTGEVFKACRLCGEVDSHTDVCPLPAVERWLNAED